MTATQRTPPTLGQPDKVPVMIPVKVRCCYVRVCVHALCACACVCFESTCLPARARVCVCGRVCVVACACVCVCCVRACMRALTRVWATYMRPQAAPSCPPVPSSQSRTPPLDNRNLQASPLPRCPACCATSARPSRWLWRASRTRTWSSCLPTTPTPSTGGAVAVVPRGLWS